MHSLIKNGIVTFSLLLSCSSYAEQIEAQDETTKTAISSRSATTLSIAYSQSSEADIDNSPLHLQQDSVLLSARTTIPIAPRWAVSLSGGYDKLNFDWGQQGVVLRDLDSWSSVNRYKASVALSYVLNKQWILVAAPTIQYAYADGTSASNAQSYGLLTSAMLRLSDGSMFGFGLAYLNDINQVRTLPYLMLDWQINDKWRLGNPFAAGFSGPGGIELNYKLTDTIEFGVGSSYFTQRFLVRDDDTTMEISQIATFLRVGWKATPSLSVSGYWGYYFNGELELSEQKNAEDIDNQMTFGIAAKYKF